MIDHLMAELKPPVLEDVLVSSARKVSERTTDEYRAHTVNVYVCACLCVQRAGEGCALARPQLFRLMAH